MAFKHAQLTGAPPLQPVLLRGIRRGKQSKKKKLKARARSRGARSGATCTVEEAAARLNIGRNQAYAACAKGEIPAMRVGKRWLVIVAALDRMLGVTDEIA
jgi:excisionase family DNA binding protein